jgi:Ca2+-binding EF-hand superfamily protein
LNSKLRNPGDLDLLTNNYIIMVQIRDKFEYFDTNYLDCRKLRACLQSLGKKANSKEVNKVMKKYNSKGDSKNCVRSLNILSEFK